MLMYFSKRDVLRPFGYYCEWIDVCSYYMGLAQSNLTAEIVRDSSSKHLALKTIQILKKNNEIELPTFAIEHDHDPLNDAISIALYFHCSFSKSII